MERIEIRKCKREDAIHLPIFDNLDISFPLVCRYIGKYIFSIVQDTLDDFFSYQF